jgi:fructoselysine-6-P-deglycase FrlB-like protein
LWRLPDPFWIISFSSVVLLIPANNVALEVNKNLDSEFKNKFNALFLGRGSMHAIAMEGALKLKEIRLEVLPRYRLFHHFEKW